MKKSSVLLLQANTIANPRASLQIDAFFRDIPELKQLKLNTEGDVFVGIPTGHLSFLDTYMTKAIQQLRDEFESIGIYQYAQEFYIMLHYCCNSKICHHLRDIGPHILLYAHIFDYLIEKTFNAYFDTNLPPLLQLETIPSNGSPLSLDQQLHWPKLNYAISLPMEALIYHPWLRWHILLFMPTR
jgi:hypothetical protein